MRTGTTDRRGYRVADLASPLSLASNDQFVVSLSLTDGGLAPLAVDCALADVSTASSAAPGQSYISTDGVTWTDLTERDATASASIKAFVPAIPEPAAAGLLLGALAALRFRRRRAWGGRIFDSTQQMKFGSAPLFAVGRGRTTGAGRPMALTFLGG